MKKLTILVFTILSFLSVKAQKWTTDLDMAKTVASASDKEVLLVFSGSDWCAPCMKLEKEIWDSTEFQEHAKEHYVLVKVDFPRKKANRLTSAQQEKNNLLAEKYNPNGYFPLVVKLDSGGSVIGKTGYKALQPTAYIDLLESL